MNIIEDHSTPEERCAEEAARCLSRRRDEETREARKAATAARNALARERWQRQLYRAGGTPAFRAHLAQQIYRVDWQRRDARGMLRLGADGYLPRHDPEPWMLRALEGGE